MKGYLNLLVLFTIMFFMMIATAFAQATLPTDIMGSVDWATVIGQAIANPKSFTVAFIGCLVILLIVQTMKSEKLGSFYKFLDPKVQFLIVTLLGQIYSFVVHVWVLKDSQVNMALVGLFSSGGAAAIFNAFQLVFVKKKMEAPAVK